nr:hypothetical protein CFP56_17980 [Quercus suber]
MADYSASRVDCPSIAFIFAHLGCILESVEGECLKRVSFFVGEDCPYTSILSSLFPLVSHFAEVARLLKMYEVRSSDLKTGLSSSDDHVISEATSVSTLYKAWNFPCSLTGKDEQRIKDRFSKQKLAEAQEKNAKGGTINGLFSKKKNGDTSKKDPMRTLPPAYLPAKRPAFPTSSSEVIASGGEEVRKKKKASSKSFLPTFWDDAGAAALKAHEALSMDDLSPLMAKSSN